MSEQNEGIIKITEADLKKPTEPVITITEEDIQDVGNPTIKITEEDLQASGQPEIKITHRNLARNPLEWLTGATKDVLAKAKTLHQDTRWWGQGKEGRQRLAEYQKTEDERQDIEVLMERIVILPDKPWGDFTDKELSEIQITQEDITAVGVEDLSSEEKAQRDREAWDRLMRERREFFNTQKSAIQTIYAGRTFQTPIVMETHLSQRYVGQEGIWSCAVASTLNALHALRISQPDDSEDSIIREMGGREAFAEDGYLPMRKADEFLRSRNLIVNPSGNLVELLQTLENGGVAVIAYGGHARMISGAEVNNGQVSLRVHDPLNKTRPENIPVNDLAEKINQIRRHYNILLIEKAPVSQ